MSNFRKDHSDLWNDLPQDERKRLMPHQIQRQIIHIMSCRKMACDSHKRHMRELDEWIATLKRNLEKYSA